MAGVYPAFAKITPEDRGGLIMVVTVLTCCLSLLMATVRAFSGMRLGSPDDTIAYISLVFVIIGTILLICAANHGLGKHIWDPETDAAKVFTYIYAGQLVGAVSMTLSKLSVAICYKQMVPLKVRPIQVLMGMSVIWGITSLIGIVLQCEVLTPGSSGPNQCPHQQAVIHTMSAGNIVTDVVLSVFLIPSIAKMKMPRWNRFTVLILFALRFVVCLTGLLGMYYTVRYFKNNTSAVPHRALPVEMLGLITHIHGRARMHDPTFRVLAPVLFEMLTIHLSFVTALGPRIHRFVSKMHTAQAPLSHQAARQKMEEDAAAAALRAGNPSLEPAGVRQSVDQNGRFSPRPDDNEPAADWTEVEYEDWIQGRRRPRRPNARARIATPPPPQDPGQPEWMKGPDLL